MKTPPVLSVINRHLATAASTATGSKTGAPGADPTAFSPGQTLRAVVVAAHAADQFTLEAGGSRFAVQTKVPLSPGQSLELRVLSTAPAIELQITGDTAGRHFSRALSAAGTNRDLAAFFSLLQQVPPSGLTGLSSASLEALQQFALLQQHAVPGQEASSLPQGTAGLEVSPGDYGPKIIQQILAQSSAQIESLLAEGKDQSALASLKSALEDIALLLRDTGQLSPAALSRLDQLSPSGRQLFAILSTLQQTGSADREAILNGLLQQVQPGGNALANPAGILQALESGLTELAFLVKGPEGLFRPAGADSLQGGLSTRSQAEVVLTGRDGTAGPGSKGGELLQQLVERLGLKLEGLLAAGNTEEAVQTVKFALLELVQNSAEQGRLAEGGRQALNTIEFFQLAQLQAIRQDALVVPLPLPFLEQGYLLIENDREQTGGEGTARETARRFSLLLKLTPLGNLRIDFLATGDGVYIRFNCASKEAADYLATLKSDLDSAIASTAVHGVSFSESGEDPLGALLRKIRAGADSLVDTNA